MQKEKKFILNVGRTRLRLAPAIIKKETLNSTVDLDSYSHNTESKIRHRYDSKLGRSFGESLTNTQFKFKKIGLSI
jgi:hypothetical protein